MAAETVTVVITDANILINFIHIGQLHLLGVLEGYRFQAPADVIAEILNEDQRDAVAGAIAAGSIEQVVVDSVDGLALFAELRGVMGRGEAACLALAVTAGCHVASDERKRFRRRAVELLGESRILRTESLLLEAIRQSRITVACADEFKVLLESNRYSMPFVSFADLL